MYLMIFFHFHSTGKNRSHAVAQLISQNQTTSQIVFWLTDWKNRNQIADEVIIDGSEALMSACVQTFAEYKDTNSYITACFDSVMYGTKAPASFIRNDRSHFVHAITHNKSLKKTHKKVQDVLLGVIGYVLQCQEIGECATVLRKIFTLTRNEFVTEDVIAAKEFLTKLISTHDIIDMESEPSPLPDLDDDDKTISGTSYKDTSIYPWICDIRDSVEVDNCSNERSIENIYFCAKAEQFVIKTFVRLPLWSNVMCKTFNSDKLTATSSASESEFKNIKRLMNIKTTRPDVFINQHLQQIFGQAKLALANQITEDIVIDRQNGSGAQKKLRKNRSPRCSESDGNASDSDDVLKRSSSTCEISSKPVMITSLNRSQSESDIDEMIRKEKSEHWKTLKGSPPLLRRSRLSILNPHNIDYRYQNIRLLRNGWTTKVRKAGAGKSIIVTDTCAMDSIFAIYCAAYLDNNVTKDEVNNSNSENEFSFFIKSFFTSNGKPKVHYNNRTKLLQKIFTKEAYSNQITEDEHTMVVSCMVGIAGFFEKLVSLDNGLIASVRKTRRCTDCDADDVKYYSAVMPLPVSIHAEVNINDIDRYISESNDNTFTCRDCGKKSIVSQDFNNIIAFEVEPLIKKRSRMKKHTISELKHTICVDGNNYSLFGVIENIPTIPHFVAYAKRNNGVWQSIDDLKNVIGTSKRITSTPMYVFMLFYIKD